MKVNIKGTDLATGVIMGAFAFIVVGILAVFSGTIVFILWPKVIPVVLPGLVSSGQIVGKLPWATAVLLSWLCGLLFKGGSSSSSSKG